MLARTRLLQTIASKASAAPWREAVPVTSIIGSRASFHTTSRRDISAEHQKIVKSTAPVLAEHGVTITTHFYKRMLKNHPELNNIFNSAHQATGTQPAALAHAVWAYAENIDNLGALTSAVSRIGHKHASLGVTADQYPIVGENLLASIKEVLGDAVNQQVIDAWAAAYQQLADVFIGFEADLYKKAADTPGGWNGWRKFKVAKKVNESDEIISFYLEPVDGGKLPPFKSGQYISVRVFVPELNVYQPRQYSLSDIPDGKHFRISVKKESARGVAPAGRISNVLHETVPEGSEIDVSNPYGDFTLDVDADTPAILISGGVGITPMLSMLGVLVNHAPQRPVTFVHATRNGKVHAMKEYLSGILKQNPQVSKAVFYEEVAESEEQGKDYDYKGRIDLDKIKDKVLLPNAHYYLCGPIPFMQTQQKGLEALGVPSERIHSEVFGSETGLVVAPHFNEPIYIYIYKSTNWILETIDGRGRRDYIVYLSKTQICKPIAFASPLINVISIFFYIADSGSLLSSKVTKLPKKLQLYHSAYLIRLLHRVRQLIYIYRNSRIQLFKTILQNISSGHLPS